MSKLAWLHLSDLHLKGTESPLECTAFEEMLADITKCLTHHKIQPDAVFFTGDLVAEGKKEQYQVAAVWLDNILSAANLSGKRDRLFIVPGNHDVHRLGVKKPDPKKTDPWYTHHESTAEGLLNGGEYGYVNAFLRDKAERAWVFQKFAEFFKFTDEFFPATVPRFNADTYYSVRSVDSLGDKVSIVCLNSAWLSFREGEQGRLLLGEQQVCDAIDEAKKKCPNARLRIALMHHPVYWLKESDIQRVEQHLFGKCQLVLRGHLHCPRFLVHNTPDSRLLELTAGASLGGVYHAYNVGQIDLDTGKGFAVVRLHHPDLGKNWVPDAFTYRNAKHGRIEFSLHA